MAKVRTNTAAVKALEKKLSQQNLNTQKLLIIDKLASHFIFTDIRKANAYLADFKKLLRKHPNPDLQFNYHSYRSIVENQLYRFQQAEDQALKAISIIEDRGEIHEQVEAYIDYTGILINLDKKLEVQLYLDKAQKLLEAYPDERLHARLICRQGILSLHYKDYDQAIELLLRADSKFDTVKGLQIKDFYFTMAIHSGLGSIYHHNGEYDKSIRAYLQCIEWCESLGMTNRLSWYYLHVGKAYSALGKDKLAGSAYINAIKVEDDISQEARAGAYANLGYICFTNSKFRMALELYQKAEKLYKINSKVDYYNFSVIECYRGLLFAKMGRMEEARDSFASALDLGKKSENPRQTAYVCKEIALFYADLKDFKNAYEFQMLHNHFQNEYLDHINHRTRIELEIKYEAQKRIQEAELLKLEAMSLQMKALRAQMNPHFLFNALNSIQTFITSNDAGIAAKYLAKFAILMRQSLEYSELEIISLEKEIAFLENYLYINQKLRYQDSLKYSIHIDDDIEEDIMGIPTMIIQPYVENAIEHGLRTKKDGLVKLEFYLKDDNTLQCIVQDNGIGRAQAERFQAANPKTNDHKSMGTSITEERISILKKLKNEKVKVKIIDLQDEYSGRANGTRVEILLPIETIQN